jgi:hypothetical protein
MTDASLLKEEIIPDECLKKNRITTDCTKLFSQK